MTDPRAALNVAARHLSEAGIDEARREARLLLALAMDTDLAGVLAANTLDARAAARFEALVARRVAREPFARIAGRREFWGMAFAMNAATLVPRPDTETLIEAALQVLPDRTGVRTVVDLGTGTGCLLAAALAEYPQAFGIGVDLNPDAARCARDNLHRLGFAGRSAVLVGSWDAALAVRADLVLSNPPYIPEADIAGLMPEVARHDPHLALAGGVDGLDAYRAICAALPARLAPGGIAVLELGIGQETAVCALARRAGLKIHARRADLGGILRALVLQA